MSEFYQGIFIGVVCGIVISFLIEMIHVWEFNRQSKRDWNEKNKQDRDKLIQDLLDRQEIG